MRLCCLCRALKGAYTARPLRRPPRGRWCAAAAVYRRDIEQAVQDMGPLVIAKHMRADHALQLRVKMRKKARVAQQHPVKENDVVELHRIEHGEKSRKKAPKAKAVSNAVADAKGGCGEKQQDGNALDRPVKDMRPGEPLLFVGDRLQILLWRRGEKALILNKAHPAVQHKEIRQKHHERRNDRGLHVPFPSRF